MDKQFSKKMDGDVLSSVTSSFSKDMTRSNFILHKADYKGGFTKVDNRILRSRNLSFKAKALLIMVLSFPPSWDFSVNGLTSICKEGKFAVKSALDELKKFGYLKVKKLKPNQTSSGHFEYIYEFYEYSEKDVYNANDSDTNKPTNLSTNLSSIVDDDVESGTQGAENLPIEKEAIEAQAIANKAQIKKDIINNYNIKLDDNPSINHSVVSGKNVGDTALERNEEELKYKELIKKKIDYKELLDYLENEAEAEEIVGMIVDQICSTKPAELISGKEYCRDHIKSVMLNVDINDVQNAIEQMKRTDKIYNYGKYFISTLFNEAKIKNFKGNSEARWVDSAFERDFGDFEKYNSQKE